MSILKKEFPILEFDDEKDALISPYKLKEKYGELESDMLVITFFKEVVKALIEEGKIKHYITVSGENDVVVYKFVDSNVLIIHGTVGCAACGGFLEDLIGLGVKKVMFCGGGGVLDKNIGVGELLVVEGAIRDEGFSYHYIAPSRVIYSQKDVSDKICTYLEENKLPYIRGITWTTDAFYRETKERIQLRKAEGAKIVEMEQAGCIAVAQFRNIKYGAIIYGGDDVSGTVWDKRNWRSRRGIRYALIDICKDLVEII